MPCFTGMGLPSRLDPEPHPVTGMLWELAYFKITETSAADRGHMTASGQQRGWEDWSPGVQIEHRLPGGKSIRIHHGLQRFNMGVSNRIIFQFELLVWFHIIRSIISRLKAAPTGLYGLVGAAFSRDRHYFLFIFNTINTPAEKKFSIEANSKIVA